MSKKDPKIISYLNIRRILGILGLLLPLLLIIGSYNFKDNTLSILTSMSAYYHHTTVSGSTWTSDVFIGTLWAIAIFLYSYKGYDLKDNVATNLAGICALGISLFPTAINSELEKTTFSDEFHLVFAAGFFIFLAYISLFLFTKSDPECPLTKEKKYRNRIFITCGLTIGLMIVLSVLHFIKNFSIDTSIYQSSPIFWYEIVGLVAFGISWLVKGKMLLSDNESCNENNTDGLQDKEIKINKKDVWDKGDILLKALIPLVIGIVGWKSAQLALDFEEKKHTSEVKNFNQKMEHDRLNTVLANINDEGKKEFVLAIIPKIEKSLADRYIDLLDGGENLKKSIENFGTLNQYKIEIFYLEGDDSAEKLANNIEGQLNQLGFNGAFEITKTDDKFFKKVGYPLSNEIRYEPNTEESEANKLVKVLTNNLKPTQFKLRKVKNRTRSYLSIMLK